MSSTAADDQLKSSDMAKAIIQANPDLKGFFGANEGSAVGVINAVKELNKVGKIVVIGYDAGKLQKAAVKDGLVIGAITQDPVGIGYKASRPWRRRSRAKSSRRTSTPGSSGGTRPTWTIGRDEPLLYD